MTDIQAQQVRALIDGLGIQSDTAPAFLEAIAISLGFTRECRGPTAAESLAVIAEQLERVADHMQGIQ